MPKDHWKGKHGPGTAHWKGGRHIAWNGYIRVLKRDHPRAGSNGYVWEHILVMEEKLGRPLKYYGKGDQRNETVHHINGIKTDNRPENLDVHLPMDHSAREWKDSPLKYPQSKASQKITPERFQIWREKNRYNACKK